MNRDRYPVVVHWNDDDEGFIATVPDLPGCSAFGVTRDAAASEVHVAIEAWIEAATAAGNVVPAPSRAPEPSSYSGKILVRMPRGLHCSLAHEAERQGVSLNQFVVYVLSVGIARAGQDVHGFSTLKSIWSAFNFIIPKGYNGIIATEISAIQTVVNQVTTTSSVGNVTLEAIGHA